MNINLIRPYWRNPRKNDNAVKAVKQSILDYGYNQPIVVDNRNVIVVGHTRYKALRELGYTEIAVIKLDLDHEKAKEYRIADNKTSEKAEWDKDLLLFELRELEGLEDMKVFFKDGELDSMIGMDEDIISLEFPDYSTPTKVEDPQDSVEMKEIEAKVRADVKKELGAEYEDKFKKDKELIEQRIKEESQEEMKEKIRIQMQEERQKMKEENRRIAEEERKAQEKFKEISKQKEDSYVEVECPFCAEQFYLSKSGILKS